MFTDGEKIRDEFTDKLSAGMTFLPKTPVVNIFYFGESDNTISRSKDRESFSEKIGIKTISTFISSSAKKEEIKEMIDKTIGDDEISAIFFDFSIPFDLLDKSFLDKIPVYKDVGFLSQQSRDAFSLRRLDIFPPLIGSINEIIERKSIDLVNSRVVVFGSSFVVEHLKIWFSLLGIKAIFISAHDESFGFQLKGADVVFSTANSPGIIDGSLLHKDTIFFDLGMGYDQSGKQMGDTKDGVDSFVNLFVNLEKSLDPIITTMIYKNTIEYAHLH